jgi:hypothetical protein
VAFSSRENSSDGGIDRQNFLAKSYEPKKARVKEFLRNNTFIFNTLQMGWQRWLGVSF